MTGTDGRADPECLARVGLSRLVEPDDGAGRALIELAGVVEVWGAVTAEGNGSADPLLQRLRRCGPTVERAVADIRAGEAVGARLLTPADAQWPRALDELGPEAPLCLWLRGPADLAAVTARAVALVGARAATGYGVHVAGELAFGLAERGWSVVSGGAYGIDGAAHRGALAAGGTTVAVLAGGVDVVYPKGHSALLGRIGSDGLLVSEWPPGSAPYPHRFLTRNRLIAALSAGTVVVEAALRSGSQRTAAYAAGYGRHLMAVPGPVASPMSAGAHQLLRDGAVCVTSAAEVVEVVGVLGEDVSPRARASEDPRDRLPTPVRRALEAVPVHRAATAPRMAQAAGLAVGEVRRALGALESAGFVERHEGGFRLSARERERRRQDRAGGRQRASPRG